MYLRYNIFIKPSFARLLYNYLQVWQCGGEILIVTCSRVGHVFRKLSPYSWPGGVARILNTNTRRTVEVWMDNYKEFFYKVNPGLEFIRFISYS